MDKWQKYIDEARKKKKSKSSRKSGKGLERSLKWFLDKGPQKKGGYPKKRRTNFSKKKFNDISAPPGAAGGLEEEVGEETFEKKPTLNEKIWKNGQLKSKIAQRLEEIATNFVSGLDIPVEVIDIRLTGSLANYNWSKYSDVDLHLVVDFEKIDNDVEMVKSFFDLARMRWNDLHDIKIYGYEVEIYVEDVGDVHHSSGIYSVTDQQWVVEPDPESVDIDFVLARKKSDDIATQINLINHIIENDKPKAALQSIERLKAKIRRMRKVGLNSPEAEFSPENIAFKILRREELLQKLSDMKYHAYDKLMSINQ